MIRTLLRKTVSSALLLALVLTAYGIGTGKIVSPVRAERTAVDCMTVTVGNRAFTVDLDLLRQRVQEGKQIASQLLSALPGWFRAATGQVGQAIDSFLRTFGILPQSDPVPTYGVTKSTRTVFTNRPEYGMIQ